MVIYPRFSCKAEVCVQMVLENKMCSYITLILTPRCGFYENHWIL